MDPKLNKSLFERLLEQCARRALQGSKWHMGVLLDYGLGKPAQSVDLSGTFSFTDMLARVRERGKMPALPAATPTNGHADAATAQAAEAMPDKEQRPAGKITVEL